MNCNTDKNVIHWRREWQTTSVFFFDKKGKKIGHSKDELPRLVGAQYDAADEWGNNSRKNEEMEPRQKQHSVVDVTGNGSKVWCYKEQYCIGTWNVRSMIKAIWKWSNKRWQV